MKPYQQIEEAKKKAREEVEKLYPLFQKIADDFSEEAGGKIRQFTINGVDVTEIGDAHPKHLFLGNAILTD